MHRGVSRCVMDISGPSSGTDHIRTRSAEVYLLLKRPLEDQSNCICPTLVYLLTAPLRRRRESPLNFYFPNPSYVRQKQLLCEHGVSTGVSTWKPFSPIREQHSLSPFLSFFLSPSEEKVKWPHMSRRVTWALSGG